MHPSVSTTRPAETERPRETSRRPSLDDIMPGRLILMVAAVWMVGLGWLFAITPEPDPAATPSALDALVQSAMLLSWMGVIAGLASRRRWGFVAGAVAGVVLLGGGVLCLVTGHTGMWIAVQIGVGLGLAGASYGASQLA